MKIIQLIPVSDWIAVYDLKDGHGPVFTALACLALVEENGFQKIVGVEGGDKFSVAETNDHFVGYGKRADLADMQQEEENNDYEVMENE